MADFPIESFMREQEESLIKENKPWKAMSNNVSALGHPCERYLVYKRTHGDEALPMNPKVIALMQEGKEQEPFAIRLIQNRGYVYARSQEVISIPDLEIRGKMDGVTYPKNQKNGIKWASEIKTVEFMTFDKLNTVADLFDSIWHWRWYVQLQMAIYHVSTREDYDDKGLLWIKSRSHQMIKPIQVPIDIKTIDETFEKCKRINDHIKSGTLPDRISISKGMCSGCDMRLICCPEEKYKAGANIEDKDFEKQLRRREELSENKSEYDKIDRNVKVVIKDSVDEYAICGPYQITVKQNKSSKTINIERILQDENLSPNIEAISYRPEVMQIASRINKCENEEQLFVVKSDIKKYYSKLNKEERDYLSETFKKVYGKVVKK